MFVVVAAATVPAAIWSGTSDRVGRFVYDYQTLITGLLAVAAAALAVWQARRTDEKSNARHTQILELSLRADRLRVERATKPLAEELALSFKKLEHLWTIFPKDRPRKEHRTFIRINAYHLLSLHQTIAAMLNDRAVEDCLPLFDGPLYGSITKLKSILDDTATLIADVAEFEDLGSYSDADMFASDERLIDGQDQIALFIQNSRGFEIIAGMRKLAAEYAVDA
ncbi:hypothetical protein IFT66_14685 [Rhizobium sp. CFBP 13726]|uniref:hypothetical protein n=1 Tax=Rhizobium sp. CFBP 13726 TaxID=2775296 RepID=UPI001782BD5D|nr:hypothetical protein [Rhizobium sp. CFBP 13726]MBD8652332.1 hypothetical protein [Rhizobium sp. CFBP 13726]